MSDDSIGPNDEELLAQLKAAFPIETGEPDAASLHRLSLAVAAQRESLDTRNQRARRSPSPWRLHPVAAASAVIGVLVAGTGIAYAAGAPIPAVHSIARTVGLAATPAPPPPVSPAVSAARQAETTLHQALSSPAPSPTAVSRDSTVLAQRLSQVGAPTAAGAGQTNAEGHQLLIQACQQMTGPAAASGTTSSSTGTSSTVPNRTVPAAPGYQCPGLGSRTGTYPAHLGSGTTSLPPHHSSTSTSTTNPTTPGPPGFNPGGPNQGSGASTTTTSDPTTTSVTTTTLAPNDRQPGQGSHLRPDHPPGPRSGK